MSRKDYELIAGVIANSQGLTRGGIMDTLAERFADELAKENPRFDRAKFLKACKTWGEYENALTAGKPHWTEK